MGASRSTAKKNDEEIKREQHIGIQIPYQKLKLKKF